MATNVQEVVSFINLKGGVGKTALSVNFAAYCGKQGLKTLLIDLDPQANATFSCISVENWEDHAANKGTVANLLGVRQHTSAEGKKKKASEVLLRDALGAFDLIPSHLDLFTVDLDLASETARETKLKRATKDLLADYDMVVCDCPPNLTIPTQNAIAFSTHFVVPVSPDFLSGIGVGLLLSRVTKLSEDLENKIQHAGIIMSRVGRPSQFRKQTKNALRGKFGNVIFDAEINERSAVSESAAKNVSIFEMGDEAAKMEFEKFGNELLERLGYE
jgi:chromosome partitioning protein